VIVLKDDRVGDVRVMLEKTQALIVAAQQAATRAYCPYSHYRVGAALLGSDGKVYTGCNVENVSYGLTLCAERSAVFNAVGAGVQDFQALVLVAGTVAASATPCGACRQVLAEFCRPGLLVVCATLDGSITLRTTLGELLPNSFSMKGTVSASLEPAARTSGIVDELMDNSRDDAKDA